MAEQTPVKITLDTPCKPRQVEELLLKLAHAGAWTDATIKIDSNKIVAEYYPCEFTH